MAQKAKNEYGKYSPDINGLRQAVTDWGGMVMVDKAVDFAKTHPRVNAMLKKANINPEQIRNVLSRNPASNQERSDVQPNAQPNSYKNRLSKLQ